MRTITIIGLTFGITAIGSLVAVSGYYKNNPVICICDDSEGDVKWVGDECPDRIRRRLERRFGDQCPSP